MASLARIARPAITRIASRPAFRNFSTTRISLEKKYTADHEWVDLSPDRKTATIGISHYAADQLGDVVYVELPALKSKFEQGDPIGAVESVKSASDVRSPIQCTIVQTNRSLEEKPAIVNRAPEDDRELGGWFAKVEVDEEGAKQYDELMDTETYVAFTGVE